MTQPYKTIIESPFGWISLLVLYLFISLLLSCQPPAADSHTDQATTPAETYDASAPTSSSTLIKSMQVQSSMKGADYEGARYAYQYSYDARNRLIKLDFWGYLYKYLNSPAGSYANFQHRVATINYAPSGELANLQMSSYNQQGKLEDKLSFSVQNEHGDRVIYGLDQWYPNPFASQPILKITAAGQLTQLPRPWNSQPNVQFALQTLQYDLTGNLKSIDLSHIGFDSTNQPTNQQSPLLDQIQHSATVLNPFGQDPAYGAVHFLVRGGLDFTLATWLDVSKYMVLNSTVKLYSMEENGPAFRSGPSYQTLYSYSYNGNKLPVQMKYQDLAGSPSSQYQVNFSY